MDSGEQPGGASPPGGRWHLARWPIAALLLGLGIRTAYIWFVTRHDAVTGDQVYYSVQAHLNASGRWFVQPFAESQPGADHPPLASALLTPITYVVRDGPFVMAQRWFTAFLGLVNVGLIGVLARRLVGSRVAVVAMFLAAVHASWWMGDGLVLSEPASVLAVLLLVLAALRLRDDPTPMRAVHAGLAGGLTALGRPEMAALVPLVVLPAVLVGARSAGTRPAALRRLGATLAATLLVVGPWIIWNSTRFEDRVVISTNDGFTLLGANCPTTYYGPGLGGYDIGCALAVPIPGGFDASQASALRSDRAIAYARDNVSRLPLVAAARLGRLLLVYGVGGEVAAAPNEGRPEWAMWIGVAQHWILLPLALLGLSSVERSKRLLVLAIPLVSVATAVLVASYWRIRVPADIALIVLAGAGVVRIESVASNRSERSRPVDEATFGGRPEPAAAGLRPAVDRDVVSGDER